MKVVCFYLPQYHPIPENDEWWGKGFTEWRNVARADPAFPNHYQPRLPSDLGFYDLRVPEVRQAQADLAREYGISAFCYYFYWFGEKRLLERPFDEVLQSGKPDFPFCLCWANENWSRRWDGSENEVLIRQDYDDSKADELIDSLLPAFNDPRYLKIDGKPIFVLYSARELRAPRKSTALWRKRAVERGLPGLYLVKANTFCQYEMEGDPTDLGFDAAVEFPPHGGGTKESSKDLMGPDSNFDGLVFDYQQVAFRSVYRRTPEFPLFRSVMLGWDNTARKKHKASMWLGCSPALYAQWLSEMKRWTSENRAEGERFLFINAWNEWAEGTYLEPDSRWGHTYLEWTQRAMQSASPLSYDSTLTYAEFEIGPKGVPLRDGIPLAMSSTVTGEIEEISRYHGRYYIQGWACDAGKAVNPCLVLVCHGEAVIGMGRTGNYRKDIAVKYGVNRLRSGFETIATPPLVEDWDPDRLSFIAINSRLEYAKLPVPRRNSKK